MSVVVGVTLLACLMLLPALECFSAPWFLDDLPQLAHVRAFDSVLQCLGRDSFGFYRPVKNLLFFLLIHPLQSSLRGAHTLQFALYGLAVGCVYLWLKQCFSRWPWALIGALFWALAPTQVSSCAWFSCSNNLLSLVGVLLTLIGYEHMRARGRSPLWQCLACAALYGLALLAYEGAIVLLPLLWLVDVFRGRSPIKGTLHVHAALWSVTLFYLALRCFVDANRVIENDGIWVPSPLHLVAASAYFYVDHLWLWLCPFGQQEVLGTFVWGRTAGGVQLGAAWCLLLALLAGSLRVRRSQPHIAWGFLWFCVTLFPMSNLIPLGTGPFADYYLPLPSVGLVMVCVALLRSAWAKLPSPRGGGAGWVVPLLFCLVLVCWRGAALAETVGWCERWRDPDSLLQHAIEVRTHAYRARRNLALSMDRRGDTRGAEAAYRRCVAETPWSHVHYAMLADFELRRDAYEEARHAFQEALERRPDDPYLHYALAYVCQQHLGDPDAAERHYRRVLATAPNPYSALAARQLAGIEARRTTQAKAPGTPLAGIVDKGPNPQ